ncbi:CaiB/BaiF CoA-transferase family protein [Bosea sp. (in: a-proteobacteria)]|uniref:CaiB/BaiF CoA transferase family protein n=1 Tax=Bosea sp. (in: a-proteobacteria) TaxID=1871050 RepID=UPI0026172351|nr:CoA transferase [Bosea sp. (in: a-proteobacteria)]MCO5089756.1 CoA transferase [Bosea sp. (in: a-proteobacteria)]
MGETKSGGALAGLRVVDLTRVLGGPYCTQILGDHGAEILKIEPPGGDETRAWGPPFKDGFSAYFLGVNRNKRSIVLDFAQEAGREALLHLLADSDVLVENFKPGTLERWGLGFKEVLSQRFPRLVHCCVSGFGADGPLGGLPGYDAAVQAACGLMSVNGEPDGGPLRIGVPIVDLVTGLNAALGIMLALQERTRSGKGQSVDVSLYDCGISVLHPQIPNHLLSGKVPGRTGNAHPNISPYDSYATKTAPLFLAVGNDGQFAKLTSLLRCPHLAKDERFASNSGRVLNRDALKRELEERLTQHDCEELAERLVRNGVPCGAVRSVEEMIRHPHTRHRGMIVEKDGYSGTGAPIKLSRTPATYRRLPPALGEHNTEFDLAPQTRSTG